MSFSTIFRMKSKLFNVLHKALHDLILAYHHMLHTELYRRVISFFCLLLMTLASAIPSAWDILSPSLLLFFQTIKG